MNIRPTQTINKPQHYSYLDSLKNSENKFLPQTVPSEYRPDMYENHLFKKIAEQSTTSFEKELSKTLFQIEQLTTKYPNRYSKEIKKIIITAIIASQLLPYTISAKEITNNNQSLKNKTITSTTEYIPNDFPTQQKTTNNIEKNNDKYNQNLDQFTEKIVEIQINCSYGDYIKNIIIQKLNYLGYKIINGSKTNPNIPTLIVTNTQINNNSNLGANVQFNHVGINGNTGNSVTNILYFYYTYKDPITNEILIKPLGYSEGNSSNWNINTYLWLEHLGLNFNINNCTDQNLQSTFEAANNVSPSILSAIPATTFSNSPNNNQNNSSYNSNNNSQQYSNNYTENNLSQMQSQPTKINFCNPFDLSTPISRDTILYTDFGPKVKINYLNTGKTKIITINQYPFNITSAIDPDYEGPVEIKILQENGKPLNDAYNKTFTIEKSQTK